MCINVRAGVFGELIPSEEQQWQMRATATEPYGGHNEACLQISHREKHSNLLNLPVFAVAEAELMPVYCDKSILLHWS